MTDDLLKRLDECALEKHQAAWRRIDGGQDLTIGAMLAEKAAARIRDLEAQVGLTRMCVACGATKSASDPRHDPKPGCDGAACTWDMTPQEAADHWRKLAHDRLQHAASAQRRAEAALAAARRDAMDEAANVADSAGDEWAGGRGVMAEAVRIATRQIAAAIRAIAAGGAK